MARQRERKRDRHGRGVRGPLSLPGPYSPARPPIDAGRSARFDGIVLDCVEQLGRKLGDRLDTVQFAVEDVPGELTEEPGELALGTVLASADGKSTRVVVYRRPIELRSKGRLETADVVMDVLVAELVTLLAIEADQIDPRPAE